MGASFDSESGTSEVNVLPFIHEEHGVKIPHSSTDEGLEDVELGPETTKKEVRAWYCYDWANSPFSSTFLGALGPPLIVAWASYNADSEGKVDAMFGISMTPLSYFSVCVAISVLVQIVSFLLFGALADFGNMRKKMLTATAFIGSILGMLVAAVPSNAYWALGLLYVLANVFYGMSIVYYNSFLSLLVKNHPQVRAVSDPSEKIQVAKLKDSMWSGKGFAWGYFGGLIVLFLNIALLVVFPSCDGRCPHCLDICYGFRGSELDSSRECLQVFNETSPAMLRPGSNISVTIDGNFTRAQVDKCVVEYKDMRAENRVLLETAAQTTATRSVLDALAAQLTDACTLSTMCQLKTDKSLPDEERLRSCIVELDDGCDVTWAATRIDIFFCCFWWMAFTCVTLKYLNARASPPPPGGNYFKAGIDQLRGTYSRAKELPHAFRFLLAFWLYSDGMWTFATAASLFAIDELNMTSLDLIILYILTQLTAALGSWGLSKLYEVLPFATLRGMIWMSVGVTTSIVIYARTPLLTTFAEFYILGALYGHEAEMFSLFAITDKGTSWLGPIALALVIEATGDVRWGVFSILPFLVFGGVILYWVDEDQGYKQALAYHNHPDDPLGLLIVNDEESVEGDDSSADDRNRTSSNQSVSSSE